MLTEENLVDPLQFCSDSYLFYVEVLESTYEYNYYYAAKEKKWKIMDVLNKYTEKNTMFWYFISTQRKLYNNVK